MPGREAIGVRPACGPASTKSGRTMSAGLRRVSRTRSRRTGVARSRRRRVAGKGIPLGYLRFAAISLHRRAGRGRALRAILRGAMTGSPHPKDWRTAGVRVVRSDELDPNTPQTPGMSRAAAITAARAGAEKLWAGTVDIAPDASTGPHHHGEVESIIYVVSGRARMRWGERLEYVADAEPGDFIFVPPYVPHQEINALADTPLSCVVVRSGQEPVVVNLDLPDVEPDPERVRWVDDMHA